MKKSFGFLLIITVLASVSTAVYSFPHPPTQQDLQYNDEISKATKGIVLFIGDKSVDIQMKQDVAYGFLDVPPVIQNSKTLVPLRFIAEEFNATVDWNEILQQVKISYEDKNIVLTINENLAEINGKPIQLEQAPVIIDGRTLVPLRFISESIGIPIQWYDKSGAVVIGFDYSSLRSKIYGMDVQKLLVDTRWGHDNVALSNLSMCLHRLKDFETEYGNPDAGIYNEDGTVNSKFFNEITMDYDCFKYGTGNNQNNWEYDIHKFTKAASGDIIYDYGGSGYGDIYGIHYHTLDDIKLRSLNYVLTQFKKRQGALAPNGKEGTVFDADTWFDNNGNIIVDNVEFDFRANFNGAEFFTDVDIEKFSKDSENNIVYDINGTGVKDINGKEYHSLNDYEIDYEV